MAVQVIYKEDFSDDSVEPPGLWRPDHVLLIYSHVDSLDRGTQDDLFSDQETIETAQHIADSLAGVGCPVTPVPVPRVHDVGMAAQEFNPANTLVFNLCESLSGMLDGETAVLKPLQDMGFSYLGGTPGILDACRDTISTRQRLAARQWRQHAARFTVDSSPKQPRRNAMTASSSLDGIGGMQNRSTQYAAIPKSVPSPQHSRHSLSIDLSNCDLSRVRNGFGQIPVSRAAKR